MGNCFSSNGAETLRELVNRRDEEDELKLDEKQIKDMLSRVAKQLQKDGKDITIVAVGGAVNTILLHSRPSTGDVDFFYNTKQQNSDVTDVVAIARKVAKDLGVGDTWLNNHTAVFLQEDRISALYAEAKGQNVNLFKEDGLTVIAAPWRYALTTKLDRLMKTGSKPYDLDDAVTYLHEIVNTANGQPIPSKNLVTWAGEFKCTEPSAELIQKVKDTYFGKYSTDGLVNN